MTCILLPLIYAFLLSLPLLTVVVTQTAPMVQPGSTGADYYIVVVVVVAGALQMMLAVSRG